MKRILVKASKNYEVCIESGLMHKTGDMVKPLVKGNHAFILTDSNVAPLYLDAVKNSLEQAGFRTDACIFPAGEESKCAGTYLNVLNALADKKITRSDVLIALGGGVTGDLGGFAAATYLRGIPYVQIPTTLLACVDSSVGGKTAIDLPAGKNLCGAFYQPRIVICDPDALKTLPEKVFCDGCAEVIKYGFIGSYELLKKLSAAPVSRQLEDVIAHCVSMKRDIVERDEFDTGDRQLLNLGHTFAHGVEALSQFQVSHGCAVAIGMSIITRAAVKKGVCTPDVLDKLLELLDKNHLPDQTDYPAEKLYEKALPDKKRTGGEITLAVPVALGKTELVKIPVSDALSWAEEGLKA